MVVGEREDGLAGEENGEGRDWSKTWAMAMPASSMLDQRREIAMGMKDGQGEGREVGFDSTKNCTFFSPIEWPGRHLNTLCVFHPWG